MEDDFPERATAYREALSAWRERERTLLTDWGLAATFLGCVAMITAPFTGAAMMDGTGLAHAAQIATAQILAGAALAAVGLPFHVARRAMNPRPNFRRF